ncbi:succinate-semialdehyde dehydrogenase (NADP(+)) [Virgibacillus indicus]|uniref:Succinate-semialdehyde dehydrogenase (NADP(+)) n=1 Tax=Virgibacillus indicus TaxID=2024554 RepID=A0A265N5S9_9BACI|nr:NAD-dependent succinate-semialdehyde dehydrogenase [Virgibacillus indicus]OZU87195.1 succinate-semialdehyde dehydrogenase (NADP(+)) [Virgibacillus indicus]
MYINGSFITTNQKLSVTNPFSNEKVYEVEFGSEKHVKEAIYAATAAFQSWSKKNAHERCNYLSEIAKAMKSKKEYLAEVITKEMGKTINDSRGEVQSAIDYFQWFSEEGKRTYGDTIPSSNDTKRIMVIKKPVGVVGAITPWNFPLSMIARKVAPALAAGCTVVLKPASKAPQSAIELCKIFDSIKVPKGVLNIVIANSSVVSELFMESEDIRKITFTGSTSVGKKLLGDAAKTVKQVSMELGGHAPFIVFDDADIDEAVEGLIQTKFRCSGQMCTATNRVFVQSSIIEMFSEKLVSSVEKLIIGDGLNEETKVGPLVDQQALEKVEQQVRDAVDKGAAVLTGGGKLADAEYSKGNFFAPTVLKDINEDMRIYEEETFGPIAPIISFENEEELLSRVNNTRYGLASYLYTNDLSRTLRLMEGMDYGMVGVNDSLPFTVQAPFGGVKESGMGKEGGYQGINEYLEETMVSIRMKVN